jgi:hypothetical protein
MACTHEVHSEDLDGFAKKLAKSFQNLLLNHAKLQADNTFAQYLDKYLLKLNKLCKNRKESLERLFDKHDVIQTLVAIAIKLYESANTASHKQILVSCFADLCYYEKLRFQFGIDENIETLFTVLASESDIDIWPRICRFSANLFQDSISTRYVLKNGKCRVCSP